MKCLAVGDLHLRRSPPAARLDGDVDTQGRKLEFILGAAEANDCAYVIFPGDVFDRADAPHGLVERAIRALQPRSLEYLFVFGQHDLRYHTSDKLNTPLGVLNAALFPRSHILTRDSAFRAKMGGFCADFYGCSWGEALPDAFDRSACNIVVMHRPISDKPLPWDHPDFLLAKELLRKCPADAFITGDNHARFIVSSRGRHVVNMGSVMRLTTAQAEHEPAVALLELGADGVHVHEMKLPIRRHVFDMERKEAALERDERIAAFVSGLRDGFDPELRFVDNLRAAAGNAPRGVQAIIAEVLE